MPRFRFSLLFTFSFAVLIIGLLLNSCNKGMGYHSVSGLIWSTTYHIMYEGSSELEDSIHVVLTEVGDALSVFNSRSLLSRINNNETKITDAHFKHIYDISRRVNTLSNGMFDPTISPLVEAWGFGRGHEANADTLKIDSLLNICGLSKTYLRGDSIFKSSPNIKFNFSAIAKGYGCDAVADMFKRNGVKNYLIEIGGEIAAGGHSPRGAGWRIGIESPLNYNNEDTVGLMPAKTANFSEFVNISNQCIATSSNLRNRHRHGQGRNGHIISPVTGLPVESDISSATVFSKSCAEADALATAAIAMGLEESIKMMRKAHIKAILITTDSIIRINF